MSKTAICPVCNKGPKKLLYRHPDKTGQNICHACHKRIGRYRAKGIIFRLMPEPKVKKAERQNKYSDKESVLEALKWRTQWGKKNNAIAIFRENATLYRAAGRFGVILPKIIKARIHSAESKEISKPAVSIKPQTPVLTKKESVDDPKRKTEHPVVHKPVVNDWALGDWAINQDKADLEMCGKIGRVVYIKNGEVVIRFEYRNIVRGYIERFNLNRIAPYNPEHSEDGNSV